MEDNETVCFNTSSETCFNISKICSNTSSKFSDTDGLIAGSFASVFAVVGFAMNLTTVMALLNFNKTRFHVTTPFIISLACSDMLFSFLTLPFLAVKFFEPEWVQEREDGFFCQLFPVLFYGNSAVTLFSLMSVTINRWVLIYFPNKSDTIFTRVHSKLIIAACWMVPPILLTPSALGVYGRHGLDCDSRSCSILRDANGRSPKTLMLMCGLIIPCSVLLITNLMIFAKVKMMRRHINSQMSERTTVPKGLKGREQRLTNMMAFIFGCFLFAYMPGVLIKVFDKDIGHPELHVAFYAFNWLTVIVNPSIYVITQERYRQAIVYLFRGFVKVNPLSPSYAMGTRRQSNFRQGCQMFIVSDAAKSGTSVT